MVSPPKHTLNTLIGFIPSSQLSGNNICVNIVHLSRETTPHGRGATIPGAPVAVNTGRVVTVEPTAWPLTWRHPCDSPHGPNLPLAQPRPVFVHTVAMALKEGAGPKDVEGVAEPLLLEPFEVIGGELQSRVDALSEPVSQDRPSTGGIGNGTLRPCGRSRRHDRRPGCGAGVIGGRRRRWSDAVEGHTPPKL